MQGSVTLAGTDQLSSNYLLNLLGINPATAEQRLGDGLYEIGRVASGVDPLAS